MPPDAVLSVRSLTTAPPQHAMSISDSDLPEQCALSGVATESRLYYRPDDRRDIGDEVRRLLSLEDQIEPV
jgi:hypothetical protein